MSSRSIARPRWQVVHRGVPHDVTGPFAIGRGEECQLRLNDPSVSRKHCVLLPTGMGVHVTDEVSRHGTRLNGEPLTTPGLAQHGDRVAVGTDVRLSGIKVGSVTSLQLDPMLGDPFAKPARPAQPAPVPDAAQPDKQPAQQPAKQNTKQESK